MRTRYRTAAAFGLAAAVSLGLGACSSQSSTLSPADNFVVDCEAASNAIGDYGNSLQTLITALTASDATAANSAADAFAASAKEVADALPGLPPQAQGFVTTSQKFSERVKDVVSSKGALPPLSEEAKTAFAAQEFTTGADAVEAFYRQQCPSQAATQP